MLRFLTGFLRGLVVALGAAVLISLFLPLPPVVVREEAPATLEAPLPDAHPALPTPPGKAAGSAPSAPPPAAPPMPAPPSASEGEEAPGADAPLAPPKPALPPPPPPGTAGQDMRADRETPPPAGPDDQGDRAGREKVAPPSAPPLAPSAASPFIPGATGVEKPQMAGISPDVSEAPERASAPAPRATLPPALATGDAGRKEMVRVAPPPQPASPSSSAIARMPAAPAAPGGEGAGPAVETRSAPVPDAATLPRPSASARDRADAPVPGRTELAEETAPSTPGAAALQPPSSPKESPPEADRPLPPPVAPEALPAFIRFALPTSPAAGAPRMAVLILDIGPEGMPAEALAKLPAGISFVVDPRRGGAGERAAFWRAAGHEVAVLVPTSLAPSAFAEEIADWPVVALVDLARPDPARSEGLARLATRLGLGLVLGPDAEPGEVLAFRGRGLPAGRIFQILDDEGESGLAMRRILNRSALKAKKEGGVILAAHSLAPSIAAVRKWLETLSARQVQLAPLTSALLDAAGGK